MKTISEIQQYIHEKTGLKTSAKKLTGSMKGYISIRPMFQNGDYPNFLHDFLQEIKPLLKEFSTAVKPVFCAINYIDIYGIENDSVKYQKERKPKPKPINENTPAKTWGSKNSQMRLDKATRRNAKKLIAGTTARYY